MCVSQSSVYRRLSQQVLKHTQTPKHLPKLILSDSATGLSLLLRLHSVLPSPPHPGAATAAHATARHAHVCAHGCGCGCGCGHASHACRYRHVLAGCAPSCLASPFSPFSSSSACSFLSAPCPYPCPSCWSPGYVCASAWQWKQRRTTVGICLVCCMICAHWWTAAMRCAGGGGRCVQLVVHAALGILPVPCHRCCCRCRCHHCGCRDQSCPCYCCLQAVPLLLQLSAAHARQKRRPLRPPQQLRCRQARCCLTGSF
jgi:hypothetical protein